MKKENKIKINYTILKNGVLIMFFFFTLFSFSQKALASTTMEIDVNSLLLSWTGGDRAFCLVPFTNATQDCTGSLQTIGINPSPYDFLFTYISTSTFGNYKFNLFSASPPSSLNYVESTGVIFINGEAWSADLNSATTTRILNFYYPQNGGISTSSLVYFNFSYFANGGDGFDKVGIELKDITSNFQFSLPEDTISASGISNFAHSENLTPSHLYLARAYIRNSTTGTTTRSGWISFDVVTASASSTLVDFEDKEGSLSFLGFLNVPELLKTKAPFAYLPLVWNSFTNLNSIATSSLATTTMSFTLASGTSAQKTISIDFFSQTTFKKYFNDSMISLFRNLEKYVVFAGTLFYIYNDLRKRKVV